MKICAPFDLTKYRPYINPHRIELNDQKKRVFGDKRAYVDGIPQHFLGVIELKATGGVRRFGPFLEYLIDAHKQP